MVQKFISVKNNTWEKSSLVLGGGSKVIDFRWRFFHIGDDFRSGCIIIKIGFIKNGFSYKEKTATIIRHEKSMSVHPSYNCKKVPSILFKLEQWRRLITFFTKTGNFCSNSSFSCGSCQKSMMVTKGTLLKISRNCPKSCIYSFFSNTDFCQTASENFELMTALSPKKKRAFQISVN